MRKHLTTAAPWAPWIALVGVELLGGLPLPLNMLLIGLAICVTTSTLVCRRLSALARKAPVSEAMARGYELANEHCVIHAGRDETHPLPRAVGESTTGGIPALHLVLPPGTVYRATGAGVHHPGPDVASHRQRRRAPRP